MICPKIRGGYHSGPGFLGIIGPLEIIHLTKNRLQPTVAYEGGGQGQKFHFQVILTPSGAARGNSTSPCASKDEEILQKERP